MDRNPIWRSSASPDVSMTTNHPVKYEATSFHHSVRVWYLLRKIKQLCVCVTYENTEVWKM